MKSFLPILAALAVWSASARAESYEKKPDDPYFANFQPLAAPKARQPVLHPGDRLAICGDSITEQRIYSRIMETYLTAAHPELNLEIRQFGWSGEQASGFLLRMTNDVLRFHPTVATTCYGMNDHHYRAYSPEIGDNYLTNMAAVVAGFRGAGTRTIIGSPGCMGFKEKPWAFVQGTPEERNLNLCELRNLDIKLAAVEHAGFADVFWPMFEAQWRARRQWGSNYSLAGKDSVHPGGAGHLVMAYAFLKALDEPGDLGTFTVNLRSGAAEATPGHKIISAEPGKVTIESSRYPYCAGGSVEDDSSIRSGMALVPFNQEFNRLMLVVKHPQADRYRVTWGPTSKVYSSQELKHGINLAADFEVNPFTPAFNALDEAVAKKQAYETEQIKQKFHGKAGLKDMAQTVADTEAERTRLAAAVKAAFVPVTHTLAIWPEK